MIVWEDPDVFFWLHISFYAEPVLVLLESSYVEEHPIKASELLGTVLSLTSGVDRCMDNSTGVDVGWRVLACSCRRKMTGGGR